MAFCGRGVRTPGRDGVDSQAVSSADLSTDLSLSACVAQGHPPLEPSQPLLYRGAHLPGGRVVSEVGKHACEPVVDFIECSLLLWSFQDGLEVGVRWNEQGFLRIVPEVGGEPTLSSLPGIGV